jgi:CRISPR-associated protein Cas1
MQSCRYARGFVLGKVFNARWVLERATRDHPQRVPVEKLKLISTQLSAALPLIDQCEDPEQLRGLEGEAAQRYFDGFGALILQQESDFAFTGRSRRPPLDNMNALLSFAYTLLANDCAAALEGVGLDPYVGFMHRPRPGRNSLALDLMEEFRAVYADRFVLSCVNQKIITPEHFQKQESGAVWLNEQGRRKFLNAWQQKKQEELKHPFLGEKISWGLVPHVQALLLARTIRGDLDEYPPFFWK